MEPIATGIAAVGITAVTGLAYSAGYEVRAYTLRQVEVPILAAGTDPIRILHLSDLHMAPWQTRKQEWLRKLAELSPDAVVVTGDFMGYENAVQPVLDALAPLGGFPGLFVFGSNDYYGPKFKNPLRYLLADKGVRIHDNPLNTNDLKVGLEAWGWTDLTHKRHLQEIANVKFEFRGVDDPHLELDDYARVSGLAPAGVIPIGVTHAPYLRVLDAMAADEMELIFAGHTHGGQLCLPGFGALVTNCDLDLKRAKGLHRHNSAWLHVSAGIGTNPYTPVRFACRPEATLLTLVSESRAT